MSARIPSAFSALLVVIASDIASAQGVCVECREPDRNYRCSIKDAERVQGIRGSAKAIEFLCIQEIARANGHQSCRAGTSYAGPCIGQAYDIDLSKAAPPDGDQATKQPMPGAPDPEAPASVAVPARKGPPQTLEEVARETVSKSKEQISAADENMKKAGDAVGGAVKKTWNCVASLFSRC
jgi:hypothetical protein